MRRKIQLALVSGALATMAIPATPARASMICQGDDPATKAVCVAYYYFGGLLCKLTGGPCMT